MNAPTWRIREGVRLLQRASHLWFAVANGDERSWHERHARQHASLCRVGFASAVTGAAGVARSARTGEILHHQTRTALRDVRDDGSATVNLGYDAEIDGEGEMNRRALLQPKIRRFNEDAVGAQVTCAAEPASTTRDGNIDCSSGAMTCMETTLHGALPYCLACCGGGSPESLARIRETRSDYAARSPTAKLLSNNNFTLETYV